MRDKDDDLEGGRCPERHRKACPTDTKEGGSRWPGASLQSGVSRGGRGCSCAVVSLLSKNTHLKCPEPCLELRVTTFHGNLARYEQSPCE